MGENVARLKRKKGWIISTSVGIIFVALFFAYAIYNKVPKLEYNSISVNDVESISSSFTEVENEIYVEGYKTAASDGSFKLLVSEENSDVMLFDSLEKRSYKTVLDENEVAKASANSTIINDKMRSAINITVANSKGEISELNSFSTSVADKNFGIKNIDNGVSITYLFGEIIKESLIPNALTVEKFDIILSKLSTADKSELKKRYVLIEKSKINNEELNERLNKEFKDNKIEKFYLLPKDLQPFIIKKLENIFEEISYTFDEKHADEIELSYSIESSISSNIIITLDYILGNESLKVSIDKSKIKYSPDLIPIKLDLLEYFFSASNEKKGYMVLPDGSGSIIELNNGRLNESTYSTKIYGDDSAVQKIISMEKIVGAPLPIFGLKTDSDSLFAFISEGESCSEIFSDTSEKSSNYNRVYPKFTLREQVNEVVYRDYTAGAGTVYANRIQPGELNGKIVIEYSILPQNSGYSEMAVFFREKLIKSGVLKKHNKNSPSLYLDIIGSINMTKMFLGMPAERPVEFTSYKDALKIMMDVRQSTTSNLKIKYSNAFKDGDKNGYNLKYKNEPVLGNKKDLVNLYEEAEKMKIQFFLEADLTHVSKDKSFDGFKKEKMNVVGLDRKPIYSYDIDMATYYYTQNKKSMLSPDLLDISLDRLQDVLENKNIYGIAPRYIGNKLFSNFSYKTPVFRDESKEYYKEILYNISENDKKIIITGGDFYSLKYADHIAEMNSVSNNFRITNESIPFYQIVLHGYVEYSYYPINLPSNKNDQLLKAIETGAIISGKVFALNNNLLKGTNESDLYSSYYYDKKEEILEYNTKLQEALKDVYGKNIINHKKLAKGVFVTTYENDTSIGVNYNNERFIKGTINIPANDYAFIKNGELLP